MFNLYTKFIEIYTTIFPFVDVILLVSFLLVASFAMYTFHKHAGEIENRMNRIEKHLDRITKAQEFILGEIKNLKKKE